MDHNDHHVAIERERTTTNKAGFSYLNLDIVGSLDPFLSKFSQNYLSKHVSH
jgi:hypothetical protein